MAKNIVFFSFRFGELRLLFSTHNVQKGAELLSTELEMKVIRFFLKPTLSVSVETEVELRGLSNIPRTTITNVLC